MRERLLPPLLVVLACAACPIEAPPDAGPDPGPWAVVFEGLPGALLSIWGRDEDDVWTVGEDAGDGSTVLRWDGAAWRRVQTGSSGTLWWVAGEDDGDVWFSGDDGLVLRRDAATGEVTTLPKAGSDDLFGILPFSDDDVWVVGVGTLLRYDGAAWAVPDGVDEDLVAGIQLYKIWGPSPDDLWVVGTGGALLRKQGEAWSRIELPREGGLFTIHGTGDLVVGVGGFIEGLVVESRGGQALVDATPPGAPELTGVHLRDEGRGAAVGLEGAVYLRDAGGWRRDEDAPPMFASLHATWVDEGGGVWAVGGDLGGTPLTSGVLVHRGDSHPSSELE